MKEYTDAIILENMHCQAHVGCGSEERAQSQKLIFNLKIFIDLSKSAQTNDLEHTICYVSIYDLILEILDRGEYILLENLAEIIINSICEQYPLVQGVRIKIQKEKLLGRLDVNANTGIEIYRDNAK